MRDFLLSQSLGARRVSHKAVRGAAGMLSCAPKFAKPAEPLMAKFDSILATVGNTPVVRINKLAPAHVNLFAKIEAFNPLGSVKDRLLPGGLRGAGKDV